MQLVNTIAQMRRALEAHPHVTLIPTMGNLHVGHLSLVKLARERGDPVVASIFVNPLQFAPHEDYAEYPRTLEHDCALLEESGCDLVFTPTNEEMYPDAEPFKVNPPPALADILEGAARPGFFTGVCTVVLKLFNIVRPAAAVFGKKDYQQLLVLQRMQQQLALPIEILSGDIIRDPTGLALSSRNAYLSDHERPQSLQLTQVLQQVAGVVRAGAINWRTLERTATDSLNERGWQTDYVAIRRRQDLGEPTAGSPLVVLGAARIGKTRLLDNIEI